MKPRATPSAPVLDRRLYPDEPVLPTSLDTDADRADYLHRLCAAWDFGQVPSGEEILALSGWRDVADRYPIPSSPAYHAIRVFFGWPDVPMTPPVCYTPTQDDREGRVDPCADWA